MPSGFTSKIELADLKKWIRPFAHCPVLGRRRLVRTTVLFGLLAITSITKAPSAQAQGYPAEMTISSPEVEVRSGPTKQCYATGKLKYGDRVWVQNESKEPGWLAITAPRGSFSWINAKQIRQTDVHTGIVEAEGGAKLRIGSSVSNVTPDRESVKIPCGSIVTILGNGMVSDGDTWLPIQAWPTEVRFIPGEAVQTRQFAANSTNSNGPGTPARLASLPSSTWTPAQAPGHPAQMAQSASWVMGQTASLSSTNPAPQNLTYPPQWSQVGTLRRAAFQTNGQTTYVLEDSRGRPLMYATCLPGMTLRDYVGRTVALYGTLNYRSDDFLRTHVMTASHVAVY
jgi:hypothetical protein